MCQILLCLLITSICFTHTEINAFFLNKAFLKLDKINQWFISNKASFNIKKTKYSFFHKRRKIDDIPLLLPKLKINNNIKHRSNIPKTKLQKVLAYYLKPNKS